MCLYIHYIYTKGQPIVVVNIFIMLSNIKNSFVVSCTPLLCLCCYILAPNTTLLLGVRLWMYKDTATENKVIL